VLLALVSVLLTALLALSLVPRLRAHSVLVEEIRRHRRPFSGISGRESVWELSGDLGRINLLMSELNQIASLINRAAGDYAHALKSPLSVVKIAVRRVRSHVTAGDVMVNAALDAAEANVERMAEIIEVAQRLDEETASLIVAPRQMEDVADAMRQALHRASPRFAAKALQISAHLQESVFVYAAEGMLAALLDDVVRNAAAVSPERGTISIFVATQNDIALVGVEDQGSWVSPDALESLWEREHANTCPRSTVGHIDDGPPLQRRHYYATKRNAGLLGGDVMLDNRADGGFSVSVSLPLV
jgi:signal transduction histidine kinase